MTHESHRFTHARLSRGRRRSPWIAALSAVLFLAVAGSALAATPTAPPPVTILTSSAHAAPGDIFITPTGDSTTYANGPEILDRTGNVVWFHAIPPGQTAADFRAQTYRGRPVLTFWQGTGLGGLASGTDYIYNDRYQPIATVNAGNGLAADGHEFLITPWNTALILAYTSATVDLTSIGGPADQVVIDGVVQEIDIRTGRVLFQWNSADHVPFSQSEQPLPASPSTPWDWFHINAVHLDTDGNLLIDARDTWTAYKVNRFTGRIIWQLGGKASSFTLRAAPGQALDNAGEIFAWQHDPDAIGHDEYTFLDNESAGTPEFPVTRAVTQVARRKPRGLERLAPGAEVRGDARATWPEGMLAHPLALVVASGHGQPRRNAAWTLDDRFRGSGSSRPGVPRGRSARRLAASRRERARARPSPMPVSAMRVFARVT